MRKLVGALAVTAALMWGTTAFAGDYSALDDSGVFGPSVGLGAIVFSGDNGAGGSDTQFVPTINISGITDMIAWQVFYGSDSDTSTFGGSADYILASNFDECATCPENGIYWFGAGLSLIDYSDLFFDGATATAAVSDTEFGVNVGGGYRWDEWGFDAYLHYLVDSGTIGFQAALLYNFNN